MPEGLSAAERYDATTTPPPTSHLPLESLRAPRRFSAALVTSWRSDPQPATCVRTEEAPRRAVLAHPVHTIVIWESVGSWLTAACACAARRCAGSERRGRRPQLVAAREKAARRDAEAEPAAPAADGATVPAGAVAPSAAAAKKTPRKSAAKKKRESKRRAKPQAEGIETAADPNPRRRRRTSALSGKDGGKRSRRRRSRTQRRLR